MFFPPELLNPYPDNIISADSFRPKLVFELLVAIEYEGSYSYTFKEYQSSNTSGEPPCSAAVFSEPELSPPEDPPASCVDPCGSSLHWITIPASNSSGSRSSTTFL